MTSMNFQPQALAYMGGGNIATCAADTDGSVYTVQAGFLVRYPGGNNPGENWTVTDAQRAALWYQQGATPDRLEPIH